MRILLLLLLAACDEGLAPQSFDQGVLGDLPAQIDADQSCMLDTTKVDCAASCGTPDGGLGNPGFANWPCKPDPLCVQGHWRFDCI